MAYPFGEHGFDLIVVVRDMVARGAARRYRVRRVRRPVRLSALVLAGLAALALSGCVAQRPEDPVVLTGDQVPRLIGADPGAVVAFRWLNDAWHQVPVQVDERAVVDLGKVYNSTPVGITQLTYTDPGTFTGPDPNAKVDADDEIAFMGIDGGVRAPSGSRPPGVVAGSGHEVQITDSSGSRRRPTSTSSARPAGWTRRPGAAT